MRARDTQTALEHPLLAELGVRHGFGLREAEPPAAWRPRQVHGSQVRSVDAASPAPDADLGEADAVVSSAPGQPVAVVTADCVPLLVSTPEGELVAAIHAGWRGLSRGVIEAALRVMFARGARSEELRVAIGPHIGPCCYEIDEPVVEALRARFASAADAHLECTRPGHARLALAGLVRQELAHCGLAPAHCGVLEASCTFCDAARFHSYRRDGEHAGRLVHWISARHRGEA